MKKRVLSLLLALALAVSILVIPAEAKFSDVSDPNTLTAIETLRPIACAKRRRNWVPKAPFWTWAAAKVTTALAWPRR